MTVVIFEDLRKDNFSPVLVISADTNKPRARGCVRELWSPVA